MALHETIKSTKIINEVLIYLVEKDSKKIKVEYNIKKHILKLR